MSHRQVQRQQQVCVLFILLKPSQDDERDDGQECNDWKKTLPTA